MEPFVHRHRVGWGDCDPAGIVYTPQVLRFVIEAMERWMSDVVRASWYDNIRERRIGSPMVATALRFLKPMPVETAIALTVHVQNIGRSSLDLGFVGRDGEGATLFLGRVACSFISLDYKTIEVPADIRERATAYRDAVGPAPVELPPIR